MLKIGYLFIILFFTLNLVSCGSYLPNDIGPNPALQSFHEMEFDVKDNDGLVKKEVGIANINLKENSDYSNVSFTIYGIYQGTLHAVSNACGINLSINFKGKTQFLLSEIIAKPTKCSIKFTAITDQIKGKQHNIVETGVLKINVIPQENSALEMTYARNGKQYLFNGQGSIQRQEGPLPQVEGITVLSKIKDGGIYRVVGCGKEITGSFEKNKFDILFKDFYKKDELLIEDSCDLEIIVIPYREAFSHMARFSFSVFGSTVVQLEPLEWSIDRYFGNIYLNTTGKEYVVVCSINEKFEIKKSSKNIKCKEKYNDKTIYWLRSITANGRKSVLGVQSGKVIWKE